MEHRTMNLGRRFFTLIIKPLVCFIALVILAQSSLLATTDRRETAQAVMHAAGLDLPVALATNGEASGGPDSPVGVAKAAVWLISLVASVLLTSFLKDRWEAARPILQITAFRAAEGEDVEVLIEPALAREINRHYYLPDLKLPITVRNLAGTVNDFKRIRDGWRETEDLAESVVSLIQGQSSALALESRRKALLQVMSSSEELYNLAKIIAGDMESEKTLDAKYQHHPAGTESLSIKIPQSIYDLSELDEETIARDAAQKSSDPNAYLRTKLDARRTNLYRRLLIYYEPDVLFNIFTQVQARLKTENQVANEIIAKLSESDTGQTQRQFALSVLVSNRGQRPVAVRGLGVLRLEVPAAREGGVIAVMIPLTHVAVTDEMVIVDGGKASTLHLVSRESIEQLVSANAALLGGDDWTPAKSLDDSRLLLLFKAKTAMLTASVALARAGEEINRGKIGPSVPLPVSESAAQRAIDEIIKSWS